MTTPAYTVVYDGDCRVCGRVVRRLARWDRAGQLEIVAFQQAGLQRRFPWIPPHAYSQSLQLVRSDGRTWQGAAAIEELLEALPRGWLISWIFHIPFARAVAERIYRWFARNRYRLGCAEHCSVDAGKPRRRR